MSLKPLYFLTIISLFSCSKSADEYYKEGQKSYENGELDDALKSLDKAIENEKTWSKKEIYLDKRAETYLDLEKTNLAISDYLKIVRNAESQDYNDLGYYYNELGNCYADLDSTKEALEYYKKALSIYENDTIVLINIASLYHYSEQYDLAENYYSKALSLNYRDSLVLLDRSECYNVIGDFESSTKDLMEHQNLFGNTPLIFYRLGDVHSFQKQYTKAIEYYNQALKLSESADAEILCARADAYFYLKELDKAKKDLKEALLLDSEYSDAYYQLAFIHYTNDEYEEAITYLNSSILLGDSTSESFVTRGDAFMRLGKKEEACADLNYASSLGDEEAAQMIQDLCN